jgi:hypothetical protein
MGMYNIGFFAFCIILALSIFIGVSENILTKYGVGLLIGILVLGIIGYDIWANLKFQKIMEKVDLTDSAIEKQILIEELIKYFGIRP